MAVQLKFELKHYAGVTYEPEFIRKALRVLDRQKSKLRFSLDIQKAWQELALDMKMSEIVANSTESEILLKFIQIALFKADTYLDEVKQEYEHDFYTPREKTFDKLRNDLTFIRKQTKGLHKYLVEIILALWVLKQKSTKDSFNGFWTSFKEDLKALREKNPELFFEPEEISISLSKEKRIMKKQQETTTKKKKVAILAS